MTGRSNALVYKWYFLRGTIAFNQIMSKMDVDNGWVIPDNIVMEILSELD